MKQLSLVSIIVLSFFATKVFAADCSVGSILTYVDTKNCFNFNTGLSEPCKVPTAGFSVSYEIYYYGKDGKVIVTKNFNVPNDKSSVVCLEHWKPGSTPYAIINSQYSGGYPLMTSASVPMNQTGMVRYLVVEPVNNDHPGDSVVFCKSDISPGKQSEICPLGH